MKFTFTPEEAQPSAQAVAAHLLRRKMKVQIEHSPWPEAPYRTTIAAQKSGLQVLVDAQGTFSYSSSLRQFIAWLSTHRHYVELYIATSSESILQAGLLSDTQRDGVGILITDEKGNVKEHQKAKNHALVVTPEPTLRYGPYREEVLASVKKFNDVDRKDGLRDLCEIVERATEEVGVRACRKGLLKIPEAKFIGDYDWAGKINQLARPEIYHDPSKLILTDAQKTDLHAFRNARNLIDHPAQNKNEDKKRQKQFAERMMLGTRLTSELASAKRRIG